MVRVLGLEPSLVRGKSPVPYQSGVMRRSGPGGNRTPFVGMTAGLQPAAPHGATDDASAVVKVLVSRLAVGRVEASSEGSRTPGRFWRPQRHRDSSPWDWNAHD